MSVATGCHTHGHCTPFSYCVCILEILDGDMYLSDCVPLFFFLCDMCASKCQFLKGGDKQKLSRCVARMPLKSSMVPVQEWSVSHTCIWGLNFNTSQNMEIPSHIYGNEMIRSVNFTSIGQLYPSDHHTLKWRHSLAVLIDPCLRPMWRSFPTIHPSVNLRRF